MTLSPRLRTALLVLFRFVLGGVFVYAGINKILDPGGFAQSIYNYQIMPEFLIHPAALVMPWVEVIAGTALLFRWWTGGASFILSLLMLTFLVALSITLVRGIDISCGCFSSAGEGKISWFYLVRDFTLFAMGVFLFVNHDRENAFHGGKKT